MDKYLGRLLFDEKPKGSKLRYIEELSYYMDWEIETSDIDFFNI